MSADSTFVSRGMQSIVLGLLAVFLIGIIFIIDLNVEISVAVGAMYSIAILYSWVLSKPFTPALVGVICSCLIIYVAVDTDVSDDDVHAFGLNRVISLIVVWVCVSMMTIAKRSFEQLEKARNNMEVKVFERTTELRESEEMLKEAQKVAKIGSWEWNPQTNEVRWSDQMFEIFGLDPQLHTGYMQDIYQFIHPDDVDRVKDISAKAAAENRAIPIEYRIKSRNGELKYVHGDGDVLLDDTGNAVKFYGTVQDITEQIRRQNEFNAFWNYSLDLMGIAGTDGKFIRVNPMWAKVLGYSEHELLGKPIIDFVHKEDRKLALKEVAKLSDDYKSIIFTLRFMTKDGNQRWLLWSSAIDLDLGHVFITARDVTKEFLQQQELQKYAATLETKNEELEQFTYIASHDLQEPLRTVISLSQLFKERYEGTMDEQADSFMKYIAESCQRMSALVKGLLDYSRIGKEQEITLVDCNDLIVNVRDDLKSKLEETKAELHVENLPKLMVYEVGFRLLFQNLISNAVKFQKPGNTPKILIKAKEEDDLWVFSIRDNGLGIAENHQERIFTIFQRLNNGKDYEGTGIGLAHCRKIVDLHGGKIWLVSELGKGSTFFFSIPQNPIEMTSKRDIL